MRIIEVLYHRVRSFFSRASVEQELDQELRYHVEREIEENVLAGMTPAEARRVALR
ncbi:MAG TPA: permease prefix domain 1-containing protein, partial [Bryobacteraceae bacterium]